MALRGCPGPAGTERPGRAAGTTPDCFGSPRFDRAGGNCSRVGATQPTPLDPSPLDLSYSPSLWAFSPYPRPASPLGRDARWLPRPHPLVLPYGLSPRRRIDAGADYLGLAARRA